MTKTATITSCPPLCEKEACSAQWRQEVVEGVSLAYVEHVAVCDDERWPSADCHDGTHMAVHIHVDDETPTLQVKCEATGSIAHRWLKAMNVELPPRHHRQKHVDAQRARLLDDGQRRLTVSKEEVMQQVHSLVECVGCRKMVEAVMTRACFKNSTVLYPMLCETKLGAKENVTPHFSLDVRLPIDLLYRTLFVDADRAELFLRSQQTSRKGRRPNAAKRCQMHSIDRHVCTTDGCGSWMEAWESMDAENDRLVDSLTYMPAKLVKKHVSEYCEKFKFCSACKKTMTQATTALFPPKKAAPAPPPPVEAPPPPSKADDEQPALKRVCSLPADIDELDIDDEDDPDEVVPSTPSSDPCVACHECKEHSTPKMTEKAPSSGTTADMRIDDGSLDLDVYDRVVYTCTSCHSCDTPHIHLDPSDRIIDELVADAYPAMTSAKRDCEKYSKTVRNAQSEVLVVLGEIMYHRLHRLATHMRHVPLALHYIHTGAALVLRQRWLTLTAHGHHDDWADTLQTAVRGSCKASKKPSKAGKKGALIPIDDPELSDEPRPKALPSPKAAPKTTTKATVFATPESPSHGLDGDDWQVVSKRQTDTPRLPPTTKTSRRRPTAEGRSRRSRKRTPPDEPTPAGRVTVATPPPVDAWAWQNEVPMPATIVKTKPTTPEPPTSTPCVPPRESATDDSNIPSLLDTNFELPPATSVVTITATPSQRPKSANSSRSDAGYSSLVSSREQTPPIDHATTPHVEISSVSPICPPSTSPFHRDNRPSVTYPITIQEQLRLMDTAAEEACMRQVTHMLEGLASDFVAAVEWQASNTSLVGRVAEYRVLLAAQEYADTIEQGVFVDERMNVTVADL